MKKLAPLAGLAFALAVILAVPALAAGKLKTAVFAGGCFWSMQHDMEPIPGVVSTVVGYSGGDLKNPTYENHPGFYEALKVTYDPSKVTYPQLVARYLRTTDPTDGGGAFCDRGPSYRPAIFVDGAQERAAAEAAIKVAHNELDKPIATKVLALKNFYPAEDYHQEYAKKNPAAYARYRQGCGKDRVIKALWGPR
jgi:peptide-methionine (S)-S-oxide reductase